MQTRRTTSTLSGSPAAITPLSEELRFVAECVRRSAGAPHRPFPTVLDWGVVLRHTAAQSVFGSVAAGLKSGEVAVPDAIQDLVGTGAAMSSLQRRHRQEPGIQRTLTTLLEAGCSPVLLKGVALAYSRYAVAEHRTFADVDLLLPVHQLERANRTLLDAGFTIDERDRTTACHQHLPVLYAPGRTIAVELHRALFDDGCPFIVDVGELLARARPTTVFGLAVRELAPEDALLHVCAHLSYGHHYTRYPLRSLADILVLTRRGEVDWSELIVRARRAQMDGAVIWPLALAHAWLGAPVPEGVLRALAPSRPLRRLVAAVMYSGYILDRSAVPDDGTKVLFDLLLDLSIYSGCSAGTQVKALLRGLFPPPDGVTHLPSRVTSSPTSYALALTRLSRLQRGACALGQLMVGAGRRPSLYPERAAPVSLGSRASRVHGEGVFRQARPGTGAVTSEVIGSRTADARHGSASSI